MEYFKILDLKREPFSNSPDPDFFFESRQHLGCLQQMELALRLRRGLNVVIGDVGTGKTTLCRQMIRRFADDEAIETHLILDPSFSSPAECLTTVGSMLTGDSLPADADEWQIKEAVKNCLFRKGVDEGKTVVLIIDEGQKIPDFCLEILRELLNYETNEYKLLQIVIFAQKEFSDILDAHANFADRINLLHQLEPLNYSDTRALIQFRLNQSCSLPGKNRIFGLGSHIAIYRATSGYPRRIINLCHRSIMTMIIQNRSRAGWFLVRSCIQRALTEPVRRKRRPALLLGALAIIAVVVAIAILSPQSIPLPQRWKQLLVEPPPVASSRPAIVYRGDAIVERTPPPSAVAETEADAGEAVAVPLSAEAPEQIVASVMETVPAVAPAGGTPPVDIAATPQPPEAVADRREENGGRPPEFLGRVRIQRGETLWVICELVYGVNHSPLLNLKCLEAIKAANPELDNPDRVRIGQFLSLPALPVNSHFDRKAIAWVELHRCHRLEDAFGFIRGYPSQAPDIRLIPHWNSDEGLLFSIVLEEYFYDDSTAQNALRRLPAEYATAAQSLVFDRPETIFFADPLMSQRKE